MLTYPAPAPGVGVPHPAAATASVPHRHEPVRVVKFHAPEIVFGEDSLVEAVFAVLRLGGQRPMLVTDAGLLATGWVEELQALFAQEGVHPTVWSALTPNPKDHEVAAGFEAYVGNDCDVVVALGGGSVIDAAKGIAILAANGGSILDYEGVDQATAPIPPLVMVPSTSGTGADVSQFCIVTDTAREVKVTIMGRALVPDITIVDPRLLTTMPEWLNAATGLDALTHGIESFVSITHNVLTDHHALRSIALVLEHLPRTMETPLDMGARTNMAQASMEAGLAFTNAILGAAHAMSHQVGGLLDLPHGVINGVLLPHVIRFNAAGNPAPFVEIARCLNMPEQRAGAAEAALAVADRIETFARDLGVPRGLGQLGVREEHLPVLARNALRDACMATNPREASVEDMVALFRLAL